ncbi:MAG: hypothetical protein K2J90_11925 [Lachnospiraceae bacterium]|nr:hypothetical protein [Lachnospiraceae bacterium]
MFSKKYRLSYLPLFYEDLDEVEEFAYVSYNYVRPHSFNGYRTPYQARIAS